MKSTENQRTRYAVVGAGWISQAAFLPAIGETSNSAVTALVTGDDEKAKKVAAKYDIEHIYGYADYDRMLADGVADAVYLALPNDMHLEFGLKTLRAGVHLLLEKPMAVDEDQCRQLIEAAEASGAKLMIAYRLHNEPATLDTIELVRSGKLGELRLFNATFSQKVAPTNHRADAEHWAGPLPDMGIYPLNGVRKLFGAEPIEAFAVTATGKPAAGFDGIVESFAVTLRFPEERLAQFVVSYGGAPLDEYTVVGTEGALHMKPGFGFHKALTRTVMIGETTERKEFAETSQFGGEIEYFSRCIQNDEQPEADGWEGLADIRALKAIEQSAREKRPVAIPPLAGRPDPKVVMTLKPVKAPKSMVNAAEPGEG